MAYRRSPLPIMVSGQIAQAREEIVGPPQKPTTGLSRSSPLPLPFQTQFAPSSAAFLSCCHSLPRAAVAVAVAVLLPRAACPTRRFIRCSATSGGAEERSTREARRRSRQGKSIRSMEGWDKGTKSVVGEIPLLSTRSGPRDGDAWRQRLKEEYRALIAYTSVNKAKDNDWFRISAANPEGTRWEGTCWYVHNLRRYEFPLQFEIPVTYPQVAPEIELPTLDGKTHKMYRGGKICLTVHFKPLWAKNCPRFGLAHALCLGLAPWLAAEVPILVDSGMVKHKDDEAAPADAAAASGSAAAS